LGDGHQDEEGDASPRAESAIAVRKGEMAKGEMAKGDVAKGAEAQGDEMAPRGREWNRVLAKMTQLCARASRLQTDLVAFQTDLVEMLD
jgi:hypothetical protein